jgi:hypothetical protein
MNYQLAIENRIRREKLPKPIKTEADEEFNFFIFKENWTIVSALSRLALWDTRRLLYRKDTPKDLPPYAFIDGATIDLISKTFQPF